VTPRPTLAWRPVGAIAALTALVLLLTIDRYDYHRDELYFRMVGAHPRWGYVDQPPFTPLMVRACTEIFGDSVWAIRIPGLFFVAGAAFLLAYIAREIGGGAGAQSLAAAGTLTTFPLTAGHITITAAPDLVLWLLVILCLLRALLGDRPRYLLLAGLFSGLALYNKHLVILLLLSVAAGLALVGPRRVLASKWLWAGAGIAVVVGLPNLLYQIANDFPQIHMAGALAEDKGDDARITLLPLQLVWLGPLFVPVWVAGMVILWRRPELRPVRAFAVAYPLMLVLLFVIAGQPYYSFGLLAALFAIGAVPTVATLGRTATRRRLLGAGLVVNCGVAIVMSLPVLPIGVIGRTPIPTINVGIADEVGWPRYVAQVKAVYDGLPAQDRARTVLLTGNYGEAGVARPLRKAPRPARCLQWTERAVVPRPAARVRDGRALRLPGRPVPLEGVRFLRGDGAPRQWLRRGERGANGAGVRLPRPHGHLGRTVAALPAFRLIPIVSSV
jgi:hypothetical protein